MTISKLSIFVVFALFITQISCVANSHRGKPCSDQLGSVDLQFQAKWWSDDQIDGLIIDEAPSQETTIILEKWDPSDPVSTPHPDLVEVVAEFGPSTSKLNMISQIRWLVGPLRLEQRASWTEWKPLANKKSIELSRHNQSTLSFGHIDLKNNLEKWYKQNKWAHTLEVRISLVDNLSKSTFVNSISKKLPILTAD